MLKKGRAKLYAKGCTGQIEVAAVPSQKKASRRATFYFAPVVSHRALLPLPLARDETKGPSPFLPVARFKIGRV